MTILLYLVHFIESQIAKIGCDVTRHIFRYNDFEHTKRIIIQALYIDMEVTKLSN